MRVWVKLRMRKTRRRMKMRTSLCADIPRMRQRSAKIGDLSVNPMRS